MSNYVVRFQVQASSGREYGSAVYNDYSSPCSQSTASSKLEEMAKEAKRYGPSSSYRWESAVDEAVSKAKQRIAEAGRYGGADASVNRNVVSIPISFDGNSFRLDVAIERGSGHFRD